MMSDYSEESDVDFHDDTDNDQTYEPESESSEDVEKTDAEDEPGIDNNFRPRKRLRREKMWKRAKAKDLRNSGKAYKGKGGRMQTERSVQPYPHNCRYKCIENFTEEDRKIIFDQFWGTKSWDLQTSFISSCVQKFSPKRQSDAQNNQRKKGVSTCITLREHRVCKQFFLKTLNISNKRFFNIVNKKTQDGIPLRDQRGRHSPANKISNVQKDFVKRHIKSFPKFTSHYSRKSNPHRKYLASSLNLNKMYELYCTKCEEDQRVPVQLHYYRKVFNTEFNLSFHKPYTDTCTTCDKFNVTIKTSTDEPSKNQAMVLKELHLRKAEAARDAKKKSAEAATADPSRVAIAFDLQKTLPIPLLTCSKVYYSRQLWTYNLGVHNLSGKTATMFMWPEHVGSRGSQEIMSCLLKYIKALPTSVKHLDAFSDNAGGQNKNQNIVKFWCYIVSNTQIETVDHKFLVSGHSFLECDQDFALIEKCKKNTSFIFVPEDWYALVAKASRKFKVSQMTQEDFKSIDEMSKHMKGPIKGIRNMQWLHFQKTSPLTLFYKETVNVDLPYSTISLKKTTGRPPTTVQLKSLYEGPVIIKTAKYKDLLGLLPFVPPIHHAYYRGLPHAPPRDPPQPTEDDTNEGENDEDDDNTILDSDS